MTIIEKGPSKVPPSPGEPRSEIIKSELRKELRSPEVMEKSGRRDSDLISTATSALRRLHFRSAGGSRPKRGQPTGSGAQGVPKLMLMGSSTASDTTTNTSTDSSNTVYTMVTVTDAEQEERTETDSNENKQVKKDEKFSTKSKDNLEFKRDLAKDQSRRMEKKHDARARDILNEFDELFLENEKRINADRKSKGKDLRNGVKLFQGMTDDSRKGIPESEFKGSINTTDDSGEGLKTKSFERESGETEEQRQTKMKNHEEIFHRTTGSSSETDDIFSSIDDQSGSGAPPPTPLTGEIKKDENFFTKTTFIDEETLRNLESVLENGRSESSSRAAKPRSNIRTIHSELPQRTFTSNVNKRKKTGEQDETRKSQLELNRISPKYSQKSPSKSENKSNESTLFPFPPRSASPKATSKSSSSSSSSSSSKLKRDISNSLKKLVDISSPIKMVAVNEKEEQDNFGTSETAPLTLSNVQKHEKSTSQEFKQQQQQHQHKFESIFNMDSPTTLKSSPPVGSNYLNSTAANNSSKFEFPSCTSPTENNNAFIADDASENSNRERDLSLTTTQLNNEANEKKFTITDNQTGVSSNKRKKRSERKSISADSPIKLKEPEDEDGGQNRTSKEIFNAILEENLGSRQIRKYSILTTDGSIKNFVSENSEEFKKTNDSLNKENINKKKPGNRRASECPQRHRRVSIIQGESLRHFIFEEPDTSKMKPNKQRKVSVVPEDTTRNILLEDIYKRKSSLIPGDTLRNLLGDDGTRKTFIAPEEKPRKFSINTLGDIVSARKFSLLPPGEIYTSQIDGKTTEIIKLAPGTKGRPLATIVVQQASIQRGSISGPSGQKEDSLLDVANTFTLEELHEFDMKYGSPHHCRSQSVKTPGRSCGRPNYLCLPQQRSRVASMPNTGVEEEYYRLRHFSITGKGVVNRGDSLKSRRSRSNNSVASSNSSHSTEHLPSNMGTVGSYPGSARTSAECSLASSRESSTSSVPYKVVMLGSAGVGKSSLISQFMTSEYLHAYDNSLDEEFGEKSVSVLLDDEESELIFVDHASADMSPENCITTYQPQAYVIVYSVVDRLSFQIAEETLQSLWKTDSIGSKAVILVGNKTDLVRSRTITSDEGKNMATSYDCKFIETSVGINHNVDELLVGILTQIRLKLQQAAKPKRNKSPLGRCIGKDNDSPKKWRKSRLTASLKVKGLLGRVWARDSRSKSCENLHVL